MSGTEKDPNEGLADDAVLATDIGDPKEREAEQLSYYGGDEDDIDIGDGADRGDEAEPKDEEESDDADDGVSEDGDEEESEEESEGEEEESESDEEESEEESEGEEDDDADDSDQEDSEESDDTPKDKGIPRHRFNEVNSRMRDAEAELARRDAEKTAGESAAVEKFDFDAAEEAYMSLLLDGKTKDAAGKRREIREAEKADFKAEAKSETLHDVDNASMAKTVDALSKEAEVMFPEFDSTSKSFKPAAVSKTLTYMKAYQIEGMTPDDAFVAALADVIDLFDLATETQGDEKPEPKKKVKKVTKKAPIKKTKEKLALQKKQARSPAGEGDGSANRGAVVPDINDLTDEELDALPEDTKARLRGDFM